MWYNFKVKCRLWHIFASNFGGLALRAQTEMLVDCSLVPGMCELCVFRGQRTVTGFGSVTSDSLVVFGDTEMVRIGLPG